jgi:hypothetical protein
VHHAAKRSGGHFSALRSTVDGELRFGVENEEHFFTCVVEVSADCAPRFDHSAMQKVQVCVECVEVE